MSKQNIHTPDWAWYHQHKERLDADAAALLEAGHLQNVGFPPGADLSVYAKGLVTIVDKHPGIEQGSLKPNGKPLSNAEKRRQRRAPKEPDEVVEVQLRDDQFKIIPAEEYIPPKHVPYVDKDNKPMPDDWTPISYKDAQPQAIEA